MFENWPTEQRHAHSVLITSLKFPLFSCASLNFVSLSRKLWTFDHQTCVISAWLDTVPSQLIVYWFIALQFHWVTLRRNPPFQKHTFFHKCVDPDMRIVGRTMWKNGDFCISDSRKFATATNIALALTVPISLVPTTSHHGVIHTCMGMHIYLTSVCTCSVKA